MIWKVPKDIQEKMNDPDFKKKQEKLWLKLEAQHIKQFGRNTK